MLPAAVSTMGFLVLKTFPRREDRYHSLTPRGISTGWSPYQDFSFCGEQHMRPRVNPLLSHPRTSLLKRGLQIQPLMSTRQRHKCPEKYPTYFKVGNFKDLS